MCACDTFRSGAVEQLLTHAMKLGVRVYEQGYSKDPAAVAAAGIKEAKLVRARARTRTRGVISSRCAEYCCVSC